MPPPINSYYIQYLRQIKNMDHDNNRSRSYQKHSHHRYNERSRSRQKNHQRRDRNQNYSYSNKNYHSNQSKNYYNNQRNQKNSYWKGPKVRTIHKTQIQMPKEFVIGENTHVQEDKPRFVINIVRGQNPPLKRQNELGELKNRITPIEKIWTSHIKQYLNDSQFVQIHRNKKSLAFGEIEYGKTMINYREHDSQITYNNSFSQSKIFSRAYFKLWQILAMGVFNGKENQPLTIASVAEGPGGFIHAMIDFRLKQAKVKDDFYSITLKIDENTRNAKDWSDGRGRKFFDEMRMEGFKINLSYGQTENGDLLKEENIDYFAQKDLQGKKCYLVTGDGGIECIGDKQFDYQQVFNVKLFLGQILSALKIQAIGGKFILKVYDCAFQITKELLTLLTLFYEKVRMVKPITSRPGNSQKYMYCEGFRGMNQKEEQELKKLLNKWTHLEPNLSYFENHEFVQSIIQFPYLIEKKEIEQNLQTANNYFMEEQAQKLKQGLDLAEKYDNDADKIQEAIMETRFEQQMSYAYRWCEVYGISHIRVQMRQK